MHLWSSIAATTAAAVSKQFEPGTAVPGVRGAVTWLATDGAARFARVGGTFFGEAMHADAVEIVDL